MKKVFISAGDPSADRHAAELMKELKRIVPDIIFFGIGGPLAESQGLVSLASQRDIAVVGFWEVAKKYRFFKKLLARSKKLLCNESIDVFIPIDYPGFNIPLAEYSRSINIPVLYYIAPQLWAWGKGRSHKLANCVDKLLVVFPFEEKYFANFGINTQFVGHPLLDYPIFSKPSKDFDKRENIIAILPGSRKQELIHHKHFLNEIYELATKELPHYQLAVAKSPNISDKLIQSINSNINIYNDSLELMSNAKIGIIKTGTSNLEAMLSGLPFVMFYKTSPLTYLMAKRLVNLPYISIVNILYNQFLVPEFIQNQAKVYNIIAYIKGLLNNRSEYDNIQHSFELLKQNLGSSGAAKTTANIIKQYL